MTFIKSKVIAAILLFATIISLSGCTASKVDKNKSDKVTASQLLNTYSNIALANYSDALKDAKQLEETINNFSNNPTARNLELAKIAWLKSRESYGQTEIFRLSNGPIDSEDGWILEAYGALEGQINAWPLDENMIDYTIGENGKKTSGNIIDTKDKFNPGGEQSTIVDVTNITVDSLTALNENGGEANVTTGYHAIEFLLWGQDQDYFNFAKDSITQGALIAGQRPLSDFTSDIHAPRRLAYLKATSAKIVSDLQTVKAAWEKELNGNAGLYRAALLNTLTGNNASKNISKKDALRQIFSGMGLFIKSELANERIAVAVLTPSEEDEHSCFSDNTHRDIVANYQGFKNILMGTYNSRKFGKAPIDTIDTTLKDEILSLMSSIEDKIANIDLTAKTFRHFDYQIQPNDPQSKIIVKLKNELRKLGDKMVNVAKANQIALSTEDVTDPEETKI